MRRGREKTAEARKDGWLLPLCVDALFLSLLLMGVALCCQSVYGLGNSRRFLILTAVGLGVLMAAIRALPRFRWAALLLVTEGYALFTWLLWDRLLLGGTATMTYIGLVLGGGGTLPDPFPAADCILFLCAALALLALPLGWAALWLRSACAVVAMTYPPPWPTICPGGPTFCFPPPAGAPCSSPASCPEKNAPPGPGSPWLHCLLPAASWRS